MKKTIALLALLFTFCSGAVRAQIDLGDYTIPILNCDFEDSCQRVQLFHGDTNNIWQIGTPVKTVFDAAHSPIKALVTDTASPYPASNHSWFDLVIWTPWNFENPLISFYHKWNMDSLTEGAWIEISYDNGGTWKNILNDTVWMSYNYPFINSENLYGVNDTLNDGTPAFTGSSNGWVHTSFQWIWFLPVKSDPTTDTVRLRFHFRSDSVETGKDGWMIDDFSITNVMFYGGVEERSVAGNIELWPNPVGDDLQLRIPGERITSARIFSNEGRLLKIVESPLMNSVPVTGLLPGPYFLEVRTESGLIFHSTFLKQ